MMVSYMYYQVGQKPTNMARLLWLTNQLLEAHSSHCQPCCLVSAILNPEGQDHNYTYGKQLAPCVAEHLVGANYRL